MWGRASSEFLSLALCVLLAPIVALSSQGIMYMVDVWVCGPGPRAAIYIVPLLSLLVSIATGVASYLHWAGVQRGVEDERGGSETRTRFLAMLGMGSSAISALIIIAQGTAAIVLQACMRA
jgi:hypothetical protein